MAVGGGEIGSEEMKLAKDLHEKLLNGAKNELLGEKIEPALGLERAAAVLAAIAHSRDSELAATVKRELQALGIRQFQRGRPRGRSTEHLYAVWVERTQDSIEKSGIFARRDEFKTLYCRNWQTHFKSLVRRENWPMFDLLADSRTPRVYAIHLATKYFDRTYEHISRACGRSEKTAQK